MDRDRQLVLAEFVGTQLIQTSKSLRVFSVLGLVLCGGGLAILAGVSIDGAAGLDDTLPPLVLFGAFTLLSLVGLVWAQRRIGSVARHPLVAALRDAPRNVSRLTPTTITGSGGHTPALTFELANGQSYLVIMAETARAELMVWLSEEGAHVG